MPDSAGIVYVMDGAGASGWTPYVVRKTLSHLPYEVEQFRWGHGYMRIVSDLTNRENIHRKAAGLAHLINDYKQRNPKKRVHLIAKSAGTVIAVKALEHLAADTVECAILLSPAISPDYRLSTALRAVRRELTSFWSPQDLFWLGLGTSLFGTADGVPCRAAGLMGFNVPRDSELSSGYAKLRQVKWEPAMMRLLHLGGHAGNSMPPFLRQHVVPLLEHSEHHLA